MSKKTILIGLNGKMPHTLTRTISTTEKKSGSEWNGKTVVFRLSEKGHPIAGVVKEVNGSVATISLALPNHDGLLIVSKDATIDIPVDDLKTVEALSVVGRDVKSWQSNQPVQSKALREIRNESGILLDYQDVSFEGFGSTFASTTPEDRDGDNIPEGAFKNLAEFRTNPVMLTDHTRSVRNLMGSYSKVQPNSRGLAIVGNITNSPHPDAQHVRALVAEGHLKTLSIGGAFFYADDYRTIEEILLYEISLVTVPANPDALFQVRGLDADFAEKAFRHHAKMHGGEVRLSQKGTSSQKELPSLVAPAFMSTSAKRGLKLHEDGYSGDGLKPATVRDARKMANGEALSASKWRKIAPWIARHIGDLDAVDGDEITAGLVAMLLWGGGSSKESARRAQAYAERLVEQMDESKAFPETDDEDSENDLEEDA